MIVRIEKFGSAFCGPCKVLDKTLEQVSGVEIVKYDVDEYEDLAEKRNIRNVPVLIFYDENNKEVDRLVGAVPLGTILQKING